MLHLKWVLIAWLHLDGPSPKPWYIFATCNILDVDSTKSHVFALNDPILLRGICNTKLMLYPMFYTISLKCFGSVLSAIITSSNFKRLIGLFFKHDYIILKILESFNFRSEEDNNWIFTIVINKCLKILNTTMRDGLHGPTYIKVDKC